MSLTSELTTRELVAFGLGCLLTLACFNNGVAQARMVPSGSMAPTLSSGDRILIKPEKPTLDQVERGDVLIFKPPFGSVPGEEDTGGWLAEFLRVSEDQTYVKRVVGLPGDEVRVKKGVGVFVNGLMVDETYTLERPQYDWGPQRVPEGKLFMLGDNRNNSFDSHYWGFLPVNNVVGRPVAVIWPHHRWKRF